MISRKALLGVAAATLLGGCATGPYYDDYAYNDGYYYDRPVTRYYDPYYGPTYYPRYYAPGPSVGLSLSYGRHWHRR
ncbi:MAG TPA: twin-arginine translocation signal domain-containing protein [Usitatibacter sp.]|nr:twin-arginine translocation signal domain-containing protein [Usitatibacter sp.]